MALSHSQQLLIEAGTDVIVERMGKVMKKGTINTIPKNGRTDIGECIELSGLKSKSHDGYQLINFRGTQIPAHRLALFGTGPPPIDQNEVIHLCNNRICVNTNHLKWASRSESVMNRYNGHQLLGIKSLKNTSGFVGVYRNRDNWCAQIKDPFNGRKSKTFRTKVEAAQAYNDAATEINDRLISEGKTGLFNLNEIPDYQHQQ